MEKRGKAFLICPVRGHEMSETEWVVKGMEESGWEVHWPPRDTEQGVSGLDICRQNRAAIEAADVVGVVYEEGSQGVHFDLGMAFALRKPVVVVWGQGEAGFAEMISAWEGENGSL